MKTLGYMVLAMIVYDLSVHIIFLMNKQDFFLKRGLNYWPEWKDKNKAKVRYQQFWTAFWGMAAVLLLIHLLQS